MARFGTQPRLRTEGRGVMVSLKNLALQEWTLRLLADGPLSGREISERMFEETWESWADEHGYGGMIEWRTPEEPLGVRLLAFCEAKDRGCEPLHSWQLYRHLVRMEKAGLVTRIQIPGHRPILWAASNTGTEPRE